MNSIFKGLYTALITPFKDNRIDFLSLERLLEYQISGNVDGIVVAGSTGEGANLTKDEYLTLVRAASDIIKQRVPLIASCNSSSTSIAISQIIEVQKIPIDGIMGTTPYYVRPTQNGLFEHFKALAESSKLPIIIYSVPLRTGIDFTDETILKLADLPKIVAFKDAGNDIERPLRISAKVKSDFALLAGNDEVSLAFNAHGGVGCVSVVSNIVPKLCSELQEHWRKGNLKSALKIHQRLLPLYKALFNEVNPIGIKYALEHLGMCSGELRAPLTEATAANKENIENIIRDYL